MAEPMMTLERFILENQTIHRLARGEFTRILSAIRTAAKLISAQVRRAGLNDIFGGTGDVNVQGELVQKLDRYANDVLSQILDYKLDVCLMASEESDALIEVEVVKKTGSYVVTFDPLDGSSNIDVNVPIGTIFSILKRQSPIGTEPGELDALQPGCEQVAAGYVLYGSSTVLVYSSGHGVDAFTLDPTIGEFILTHRNIRTPNRGRYYSANESNTYSWPEGIRRYLDFIKTPGDNPKRPYSSRYVGSLVADFHRNMLAGGIFLYPATQNNPSGKLRLLYEAAPLAFLMEQAGGLATDGTGSILDIKPHRLHQRTPLIIGSRGDVLEAMEFIWGSR